MGVSKVVVAEQEPIQVSKFYFHPRDSLRDIFDSFYRTCLVLRASVEIPYVLAARHVHVVHILEWRMVCFLGWFVERLVEIRERPNLSWKRGRKTFPHLRRGNVSRRQTKTQP